MWCRVRLGIGCWGGACSGTPVPQDEIVHRCSSRNSCFPSCMVGWNQGPLHSSPSLWRSVAWRCVTCPKPARPSPEEAVQLGSCTLWSSKVFEKAKVIVQGPLTHGDLRIGCSHTKSVSLEPPRNPRWKGGFQPNRPLGTPAGRGGSSQIRRPISLEPPRKGVPARGFQRPDPLEPPFQRGFQRGVPAAYLAGTPPSSGGS